MNQVIQVTLDERGQILIPASEREHVPLAPGMTLVVEDVEGGGLLLSLEEDEPSIAIVDGMLVAVGEPLSDLTNIVQREREQRVADLSAAIRAMRILFDTSVLIASLVEKHPSRERALPWFERVTSGRDQGFIGAHSLAELYATLTPLPIRPAPSPSNAVKLIQENILNSFEIVALSPSDYVETIEDLAAIGIIGGATYDALLLKAAENAQVDQVATFNEKHFRRVFPSRAEKIVTP